MLYIITGVSRGLGKAIAQRYLDKGNKVIGVGRSHSIDHSNFTFLQCDLGNLEQVSTLFANQSFEGPVTLINNAGIIGNIGRISDEVELSLEEVMAVNVTAPTLLLKSIYANCKDKNQFTLVNISSGAANRAIPSWASYCASKAALNMLTEAFHLEEQEKGNEVKTFAVAPGVIDTGMQKQIRSSSIESFSAVDNFQKMKDEGVLFSADDAAKRLEYLLNAEYNGLVFHDLRDINP